MDACLRQTETETKNTVHVSDREKLPFNFQTYGEEKSKNLPCVQRYDHRVALARTDTSWAPDRAAAAAAAVRVRVRGLLCFKLSPGLQGRQLPCNASFQLQLDYWTLTSFTN